MAWRQPFKSLPKIRQRPAFWPFSRARPVGRGGTRIRPGELTRPFLRPWHVSPAR